MTSPPYLLSHPLLFPIQLPPGVDDGSQSMEESISLLTQLKELGYKKVITTPHVYYDSCLDGHDILYKKLEELKLKLEENNSKMNYAIIYPETIGDIYKEGLELHNCVFSYLDFIIDRKSIILFLRNLNFIDEPYVTIELNPSTLEITQKSGFGDSEPDEIASLFLDNWYKTVVLKNKRK